MSAHTPALEVFIETHSLIRERTFPARDTTHALHILQGERATGKMIVNLTNGSIGSIQFEERARLDKSAR